MTLLPPSIADNRFLILEDLIERLQAVDLSILAIYDIDTVTESALYDLADQFNVLGLRGWNLAETIPLKRALIKEAIALHQKAGTGYAVRRSLALVGYPNATLIENPPLIHDGSVLHDGQDRHEGKRMFGFIVVLDSTQSLVTGDKIDLIIALINEWKNARSRLLDLRIGTVSLFNNLLIHDGTVNHDASQTHDGVKNLLILQDFFDTAVSTPIASHVPNFSQPGFAYQGGGIANVSTGILVLGTTNVGIETGVSNLRIAMGVTTPVSGAFNLFLRRQSMTFAEDVRVVFPVGAVVAARSFPGSILLGTSGSYLVPSATRIDVVVELRGSRLRVWINEVLRIDINNAPQYPNTLVMIGSANFSGVDYLNIQQAV